MNSELIPLADRLLSALLTGCYQGLLLTLAVWLFLRLSSNSNAATRYVVWCITLAVVAALPAAHLARGGKQTARTAEMREEAVRTTQGDQSTEAEQRLDQPLMVVQDPGQGLLELPKPDPANIEDQTPSVWPEKRPRDSQVEEPAEVLIFSSREPATNARQSLQDQESRPLWRWWLSDQFDWRQWSRRFLQPWGAISLAVTPVASLTILSVLVVLCGARLLALLLQLFGLRRLRRNSVAAPEWLRERFEMVARQAGLRRPVQLRVCADIHSPMVIGFLPSVVLIPENLLATPDPARLNPVLRHEIAHVQRFDDWLNLGQQALRALFGFHPAVLWISRKISTEREIACDDHVLNAGQKPRDYARFLTEFARRDFSRTWTAAPAAWSRKSQLTERVNMILKTNRSTSPRLGRVRVGVVSATLAGSVILMLAIAPQVSLGREPGTPAAPAAPPAPKAEAEPAASCNVAVPAVAPAISVTPVKVAAPAVKVTAPVPVVITSEPRVILTPRLVEMASTDYHIVASGPRAKNEALPGVPAPPEPVLAPGPVPEGSLEERLQRVERLLDRILHQQPTPPGARIAPGKPYPPPPATSAAPRALPEPYLYHQDMDKMRRSADEQAKAQQERAHAMAKQAEQHAAAMQWRLQQEAFGPGPKMFDRQREALEQKRRALEKQMQMLEEQLNSLEQEQERIERDQERFERDQERMERDRERREQQLERPFQYQEEKRRNKPDAPTADKESNYKKSEKSESEDSKEIDEPGKVPAK